MLWLWIAAGLLSGLAAALIVLRAAAGGHARAGSEPDLAVYRRQMSELDELADRGLIAESERRSVRAETGRRLLAAAHRGDQPLRSAPRAAILAAATVPPLAALAAYLALGAPGLSDQPFAKRLAEWRSADPSTLTAPQMAAILRVIAADRPSDPTPLQHLAEAELASGQPTEAVQALQRALALAPRRADLWDALGEAQVATTPNGDLSPDARTAFRQALALTPGDPEARYALARGQIASGQVASGLATWRALDAELQSGDPRKAQLEGQIAEVARTGVLPAPGAEPGPAQAPAVGPAQIQAMVDGLAARLKAQPDDPAGWVRLVRALSVLGETARRDAALADARQRYAGRADVLAALDAAAKAPN